MKRLTSSQTLHHCLLCGKSSQEWTIILISHTLLASLITLSPEATSLSGTRNLSVSLWDVGKWASLISLWWGRQARCSWHAWVLNVISSKFVYLDLINETANGSNLLGASFTFRVTWCARLWSGDRGIVQLWGKVSPGKRFCGLWWTLSGF